MSTPNHDYEALMRRALAELRELKPQVEAARLARSEPIAIVGIGCRFPGGAVDAASFWRALREGVDGTADVPAARWNADDYYDADRYVPGKMCTRRAGFVDDLFGFDARFFDILPREAATMDPQQRLLLEVAYEALEHANLPIDRLYGSRTGVFIGISTFDSAVLQLSGDAAEIDAYVGTGNALSAASGRLSYVFGLTGPSLAVDTACSSSLVATHLACSSLRARECNLALVGGVNALISPAPSVNFSQAGMLAPDGRCKTFDASADGYVRGEGCGVLVLKRLSDARADGDAILAVIRGSATNQDGPSGGLTVPNGPAQEAVIQQALSAADTDPEQISYVEAHGTGTSLGDPIEVNALAAALCKGRTKDAPLLVGAVKTNIGHCEAAAGVAGIIKVALSLAQGEIPPHLHFDKPNPHIDWNSIPVEVVTRLRKWPADRKAIAGVSSFGFTGTNAHVILEEAPREELPADAPAGRSHFLLPLSARTPDALKELAARFERHLDAHPELELSAICRTAALGRRHLDHRLAVIGVSKDELREQLAAFRSGTASAPSISHGHSAEAQALAALGERYVAGGDIDWAQSYGGGAWRRVPLPTYPFQHRQYPLARPRTTREPLAPLPASSDSDSGPETSMAEATKNRRPSLVAKLCDMTQALTGMDAGEIDAERNLFTMGFDSITLMRLRQSINKVYGLSISMSDLSKLESLAMIADFLDGNLPPEPAAAPEPKAMDAVRQESPATPRSTPVITGAPDLQVAGAANSELGAIFAKQLDLMAKQIELLSRSGSAGTIPAARPAAAAAPPTPATPVTPPPAPRAATPPVSLPSYKPLGSAPRAGVSDQQKQEIQALVDDYGRKTQRSKEMTQAYRPVFANIRNVAGFRPEWKELIYQIIVDKASGCRFTDIDGREYLDITMGFGVYLFGHRPPFIESAVRRSLERGAPIGPMCGDAGEVARRIHELTGVDRVAFFNTGSEAVMSAIRLARTVARRPKVVMFAGSYHGHTDNLLATGHGSETVPMIPGTPDTMVQETCVLPYGEDESLEFIEAHAHELAAVLVEPVQSRRPEYQPAEFLRKLRAVTEKHGIALIFDEVILGFRILPGGAQAWFGIQADMVTYGKTIGGGMPIGIVAGKSKYLNAVDGGMWRYGDDSVPPDENTFIAGTFNHHPLAMAAALAVLEELERQGPELYQRLNRKTADLARRLNDVFEREQVPIKVVYFGSLFRFKLTGQWELFCYYMLTRGVYIWEGRNCFLSTAHTDDDLDFLVRAVEDSVADMIAAGASRVESAVPAGAKAQKFPLTTAQHRMYALSQVPGAELAYHVPLVMVVDGPLNEGRVRETLQTLGRRHEALRTGFVMEGDGIVQVVRPEIDLELERVEVGNDTIDDVVARFIRPFDLSNAPLVRMGLGDLPDGRRLLLFDAQHIIFDGVSVSAFFGDFLQAYAGEPLPALATSYRAYVEREQAYLKSADCARDEAYWIEQLAGDRPAFDLPADRPRPARKSFAGFKIYRPVDQSLSGELRNLARRRGTTLNIVLLAAHFVALRTLTGADDIIVGCGADGRSDEDLRSVIGMFVHTFVVRGRPEPSKTLGQFLDELKQRTLEAQDHARYPYEVLVEKICGKRDPNRNPLFDTVFVYEKLDTSTIMAGDLTFAGHDVRNRTSIVDLNLDIQDVDGGLNLSLEFNTDIFETATAEAFLDRYVSVLRAFAKATDDLPLHRIESISPAERHQLLQAFNNTKQDIAPTTVPELFEAQVGRDASAIALTFNGESLSYGELNARANRLAHYLITTVGAGPGQLVGISLERSIDMVVALLATLKAGAAYLPLDPSYPEARRAGMIAEAKPVAVLTAALLHARKTVAALAKAPTDNPADKARALRPDSAAYVIYTSGSTGAPKGVVMEHRGLANYAVWAAQTYTQGRPLAFPLFTTLSFDLTVTSIFVPLITGGRIVVYADDPAVPAVMRVIGDKAVDVVKLTPAHLAMISHLDLRGTGIRTVIVGGEDLKSDLCRRIVDKFDGQIEIFNEYGPTEAAVGCMIHKFDALRDRQASVPIGVPIANARIHILDAEQRLVPIGAIGELYVAGDGLARGYLGRPDLTAERFLPDPFSSEPGARIYRTGDLARWRADGMVEFLGRTDHQVKIRGFRVELGDVEAALTSLNDIGEAAVVAHEDSTGALQLVAYVTATGGALDAASLRRQLEVQLPTYMVPSAFVVLDRMPLSSNGKLDRAALPSPDAGVAPTGAVYEGPRDDVERALVEVWQAVLGRERVSIHDNFFDLGGDSIKALQVVMRLKQRGYSLSPADLFDREKFSEVVDKIRSSGPRVSQAPVTGSVPLTPVQSWFASAPAIDAHHFNQSVLLRSERRLREPALRAVLQRLQAHHDALRMRYRRHDGQLVQENAGLDMPVSLATVDLRDRPDEAERAMAADAQRVQASLDLEHGPLMRAVVYQLPDADRLLLVIHHLVIDGVSWRILLEDLASGYAQAESGRTIAFPPKTDSFQAAARGLQSLAASGALETERAYWNAAAVASPPIPGNEHATDLHGDAQRISTWIKGATAESLAAGGRASGAGVEDLLLTALARALRRELSWNRTVVTLEHHGRGALPGSIDVSRTVGWFTVMYPLTLELPAGDEPGAHLAHTRDVLRRVPNRGMGYGVLRYLTPASTTVAPEPKIIFNYLGHFAGGVAGGFRVEPHGSAGSISPRRPREHELEVEATLLDEGLEISLTFGGLRHDRHVMNALLVAIESEMRTLLEHGRSSGAAAPIRAAWNVAGLDATQLERAAAAAGVPLQQVSDAYPLSPLQEGMLLHGLMGDDTGTFFTQFNFTIEGSLDPDVFRRSWQHVMQRHDILRALFVHQGVDRPLHVILRERELPFHFEVLPSEGQHERIAAFQQMDRAKGFDLGHDVLMRAAVLQKDPRHFVAVLSTHHILMDGWCIGTLFSEMAATYRALSRHQQPKLPEAARYGSYIQWLQTIDLESSRGFWKNYLRGFSRPTGLPQNSTAQDGDAAGRKTVSCELSAEDTARLTKVIAQRRVTLSSVLRTAWSILLGKYNASDDVVFGVVVSGRPPDLPCIERMIGMFINTVPLRIRLEADLGMAAFARKVQDEWPQLEAHQYLSLADVQSLSSPGADLIDHSLVVQNYPISEGLRQIEQELEGLFTIPEADVFGHADYALMLEANPGERLEVALRYDRAIYQDQLMNDVRQQLHKILVTISAEPDTTIGQMRDQLMSPEERAEREAFAQSLRTVSQEF